MPLDQFPPYLPMVAVVGGILLLLFGQRARLSALVGKFWPAAADDSEPADEDETEITAHEAYACVRRLLAEVEDCPKAVHALELVVMPALISGVDSPHYQVTWEAKP